MTVYVDNAAIMWKGKLRFHLIADCIDELHKFCAENNIKRCWYHRHKKYPHYDITYKQKLMVLEKGAIELLDKQKFLDISKGSKNGNKDH